MYEQAERDLSCHQHPYYLLHLTKPLFQIPPLMDQVNAVFVLRGMIQYPEKCIFLNKTVHKFSTMKPKQCFIRQKNFCLAFFFLFDRFL